MRSQFRTVKMANVNRFIVVVHFLDIRAVRFKLGME